MLPPSARGSSATWTTAIALGEQAVAAAPSPKDPSALWARLALIDANAYLGRFDEIPENLEAIAAYSRQSGDRFWKINSLGFSAIGRLGMGDTAGATRDVDRAIALGPGPEQSRLHALGDALFGPSARRTLILKRRVWRSSKRWRRLAAWGAGGI